MHPKPGSNMGAMSGCFSSTDDKSDKESNKTKQQQQQQVAPSRDAELGCGVGEQGHLLSEKHLELPIIDWLNLPSHFLGAELSPDVVVPDNDDADADADAQIPANLFFWSDYHTDFDGTPDYKEIVDPKYDAILLKCATAPAEWQVPDLQLPMASTYDFVNDFPSSSRHQYHVGKTATSLPCIPTAFEPIASASREGSGSGQAYEQSEIETSTTPYQSVTDIVGGGVENFSYQRAFLQRVNMSYQTATSVQWQRATRAELQGSAALVEEAETADRTEPTPWQLPEEEVKELRERSQQYLKQFDYKPTRTGAASFLSLRSDYEELLRPGPTTDQPAGATGVRSHSALVCHTAAKKEKVGNTGPKTSQERNTNPDIEYFKQQLAPILTTVGPSHGALDDTGRPWPSDGPDEEEDDGYYPELLEDPRPIR